MLQPMSRPYLLMIEDDLADAELARAALLGGRFEVDFGHAFDGEQGLSQLRSLFAQTPTPSAVMVLLDLGLPGVSGMDVLQEIKTSPALRAVPVVVFSGTADAERVKAALQAHANAYIHKADDVDLYARRINQVAETFLLYTASPLARPSSMASQPSA